MNFFSRWTHKQRMEHDLSEEMAAHLAEKIDQLLEDGHTSGEARRLAHLQFGNLSLKQEDSRSAWGANALEQLLQDLRFGARILIQSPGFTITAITILALGIGLNTAMFSAVKAVLLSALPYPEPDRIVELRQTAHDGHLMNVSNLDFQDWRAQSSTFQSMSAYGFNGVTISGDFPARHIQMAAVGTGFFDVMQTEAIFGRTFSPREQQPGGTPTVVLSYDLAQTLFGTPASALTRSVHLNGMAFTVIGVTSPGFGFPENSKLWLASDLFPDDSGRSAHNNRVVGRLKSGVSLRQAQADMNVIATRLGKQYADDKDEGIRVIPLYEFLVSGVRPALLILDGAVALVLLVACVNISNLQMARATARRKEISMRYALGAARGRILRQLLTESVLLSGAGGLLGLALAQAGVYILRTAAPANIPRLANLSIDGTVLGFSAILSLVSGVLFGILPAFESAKADVNETLKQAAPKGETSAHKRWSHALVIAQITLATVLLSGAALLLESYSKLANVNTGFSTNSVYVADLTWPIGADGNSVDGAYVQRTTTQILDRVRLLPGIRNCALVNGLPFDGAPDGSFEIQGRPLPVDPHQAPDADYRLITPDYFAALGIPILAGRTFSSRDDHSAGQVAIVNQAFVRAFFPKDSALGKRIRFFGFDRHPQFLTIVGIIPDLRNWSLQRSAQPEVYADYLQHADTRLDATLVIRGPAALQSRIGRIVMSLDQSTAVEFKDMDSLISGSIARERFQTALLTLFAACALLLAITGIYGLLSFTVARRTSEIGLRMALGATKPTVIQLVLGQGLRLVLIGIACGVTLSLASARLLQAMLFETSARSPEHFFAIAFAFLAVGVLGCYLPALQAANISPSQALRTE